MPITYTSLVAALKSRTVTRDLLRFYWACVKLAFAGWFKRVEGWTSGMALLVGVALLFVTLPPAIEKTVQSIPSWFFLALFLGIILARLLLAPYLLFKDERTARQALERVRLPVLELALPDPPVIQSISRQGHTSETWGGTRQTVTTSWEMDVVALTCINKGETRATGCRARLMSMTKVLDTGDSLLRVITPIALPWEKEDPEASLVVDLAPNEMRRIWIGGVRSHGHIWLFREANSLPVEYRQLLGAAGTYRLQIQLDGEDIPPQQIEIEIIAAEGPKPENGIWRGKAEVSIRAQGAPRIETLPEPAR